MRQPCLHRGGLQRGVRRRIASLLLPGLAVGFAPTTVALAQTVPVERASVGGPYATYIGEASERFGIPAHWIAAVLGAESAGDPRAVSSAGAMGLMQVMPGTWAELRVRHRLGNDPFDVRDNILAGTAYLREMFDRYGNIGAMLAAYNAGPGRYEEYLTTGRPLPAETRDYIAALVPILAGEPLPESIVLAASVPADWRESPLFVTLFGTAPAASSPPSATANSAPGDAIFVSVSSGGGRL